MNNELICPISGETPKEERANYFTHLTGLYLSLVGIVILILACIWSDNPIHLISCSIYGFTLILLYGASTYYHSCKLTSKKYVLKIVDHACIYLLIAGTYTPFTLGPLKESGGLLLLCLVWGIAAVGILLKIIAINRFELLSVIAYLVMGWLVVYNFSTLFQELSLSALIWLIAGGVTYSLGTIFFLWDNLSFNHAIWHVFVLVGSLCHYFSILNFIQN